MAHPDFEELLAEFNASRVKYLIGGAHAVALHARPRASKDLDVYIEPTRANARRALSALRRFFGGRAPEYVSVATLLDPNAILQLGVAPVRIDLLSHMATVSFREAWRRRVAGKFGSVRAQYIGVDDLIAEKSHFARPQDIADLVSLRRAKAWRSRTRKSKTSKRVEVRKPVKRRGRRGVSSRRP